MRFLKFITVFLFLFIMNNGANAQTFSLPSDGGAIIGKVETTVVKSGENFSTIARRHDLGYYQLVEANPGVSPDHPKPGTILIIPNRYVLPDASRKGLVINLSELRLYYYPKNKNEVITFPIGVGRKGWLTPLGKLSIIEHKKNPVWYVPNSIREYKLQNENIKLPKSVPPGPDNPLGEYMMRLSKPSYLLHGTNDPGGIGRRSTSGCISLYPEDIEQLYNMVKNGTAVYVINEPYKVGWESDKLYLEAHEPLSEPKKDDAVKAKPVIKLVDENIKNIPAKVNWKEVLTVAEEEQGLPQLVGAKKG